MKSLRIESELNEIDSLKATLATKYAATFRGDMRLITTYAMMKAANMAPVNHKLHPQKHMAWDHMNNWPGPLGTSLNDLQYAAVEEILRAPQLAGHCMCGQSIPYGQGVVENQNAYSPTGLFCSQKCADVVAKRRAA